MQSRTGLLSKLQKTVPDDFEACNPHKESGQWGCSEADSKVAVQSNSRRSGTVQCEYTSSKLTHHDEQYTCIHTHEASSCRSADAGAKNNMQRHHRRQQSSHKSAVYGELFDSLQDLNMQRHHRRQQSSHKSIVHSALFCTLQKLL